MLFLIYHVHTTTAKQTYALIYVYIMSIKYSGDMFDAYLLIIRPFNLQYIPVQIILFPFECIGFLSTNHCTSLAVISPT
jgi:hypothetical protein